MIFVTIGTQEPFDRLIKAIDEIALNFPDKEFVAQTFNGNYIPKNLTTIDFVSPDKFEHLFNQAELIISHAGMGTIISALTKAKPIIVLPRLASLGEHRNEHQLATAKRMESLGYIRVADDIEHLKELLQIALNDDTLKALHKIGKFANSKLIQSIQEFINP